jgi:hypothetical protein
MYKKPANLFNVDANPKTVKGQKLGYITAVLYMAPYKLSGINLCAMAEIAGCIHACLNTAGNPAYAKTKETGRLNKARYFIENEIEFMQQMAREIFREYNKAINKGFNFMVRPNGTTDIRWENIAVTVDDKLSRKINKPVGIYKNIMALFPEIQFYDYTKISNRKDIPANYDITFSYSGILKYQPFVDQAIKNGLRVAVVFRDKNKIPATFKGLPVVSGDDSDLRPLDPHGVIVALYAKGKAKKDYSGFVVDAPVFQMVAA